MRQTLNGSVSGLILVAVASLPLYATGCIGGN